MINRIVCPITREPVPCRIPYDVSFDAWTWHPTNSMADATLAQFCATTWAADRKCGCVTWLKAYGFGPTQTETVKPVTPLPPTYSTKQRAVAVHIADELFASWVSVDGHGIRASKVQIIAGGAEGKDDSKLVIEVPMFCVEVVP